MILNNYKKISLWDFPPTRTFMRIKSKYRHKIINEFIDIFGKESLSVKFLNDRSIKYGIIRNFSGGALYCWRKGFVMCKGKRITKNTPLWVIIEISEILSKNNNKNNKIMEKICTNIEYYCAVGGSTRVYNPKLPILITPEFVSLIFHFCGDGHMSFAPAHGSSYCQTNKDTLKVVYHKLRNCFGNFRLAISDVHLRIPKIITWIYAYYFNIKNNRWHNARIPYSILKMPKNFLLAGLISFLIDEANIGEVIEIYSKNYDLLNDIRQIGIKCGYKCGEIKSKIRYGTFDSYRFLISSESYLELYNDILILQKDHPLCGLAHKDKKFKILVRRKQRKQGKGQDRATKNKIITILKIRSKTISELAEILNIGHSSVREHLWALEKDSKIIRLGKRGRNILWKSK